MGTSLTETSSSDADPPPSDLRRRLHAARRLAADVTLDADRHETALAEADRVERELYILHGVRT